MYQYWPEPSGGLIPIPKLDAVPAAPIFGNFSGNTYQIIPIFPWIPISLRIYVTQLPLGLKTLPFVF